MRGERTKWTNALFVQDLERVECLMVVGLLRHAEVQMTLVPVSGEQVVTGSYGIAIVTDHLTERMDFLAKDMASLSDGMPGVSNPVRHALVAQTLKAQTKQGKKLTAIYAVPSILRKMGLFTNKHFTYYPGWEKDTDDISDVERIGAAVKQNKGFTTGCGLGTATDFGLALVAKLCGSETVEEVKRDIQHLDTLYD